MNRKQMFMAVAFVVAIVYVLTGPVRNENRRQFWNNMLGREGMVNKKCPDGTRSDGPCLLEFPTS